MGGTDKTPGQARWGRGATRCFVGGSMRVKKREKMGRPVVTKPNLSINTVVQFGRTKCWKGKRASPSTSVMVDFTCQLGWATNPWYSVEH